MCTGRVDLKHIFYALMKGVDGVLIVGCRLNECKFATEGNYFALNTVLLAKRLLEHAGIEPERVRAEFMSSADGPIFARVVKEMVEKIRGLGPLDEVKAQERLGPVAKLIPYIKIQLRKKLEEKLKDPSLWDKHFGREEIEQLLREVPSYWIDPEECRACMACLRRCPAEAIEGGKKLVHVIDQERCIKCGSCLEACRFGAVKKLVGQPVPPPPPEEMRQVRKEAATA